jgi:hypothetical protein
VSYNYFSKRGFESKLEHYGTSKKIEKNKKTSNYNLHGHIQDKHMEKKIEKELESYILVVKLTTYGEIAFWSKI